jgi:type II secretion system protein C
MKYVDYIVDHHQKIANITGTVLVAWILSALVASVIALFLPSPTPMAATVSADAANASLLYPQQQEISFYMPICERNLFDSLKQSSCSQQVVESTGEETTESLDPNADPVKSSINAKLLGTMVSNLEKYSFASIQESGAKEVKSYRINDSILGQAKIYAIERNRVFFTNNGRKEYLEVDKLPMIFKNNPAPTAGMKSGAVKAEGGKITVSRQKVDSTLQDLNQVIQQARMVPNYDGGAVDGFKIFGIRGGSIFQELGLQNGDVINRINGTQIDSLEKALPMLQLLKTESSYTIDITRKGSKQTMDINIQ